MAVRVKAVAVRRAGPGQQDAGPIFHLPTAAHAISNQGALIFGDGATNLEQQAIMWVVTHRAIQKLDLAPIPLQFIQHDHLLDIVAGEAVGRRHQHPIPFVVADRIPQMIQVGAVELGAAPVIVPKDVLLLYLPPLLVGVGAEPVQLRLNRLRLRLVERRHAGIDRYS